MCYPLPWFPLSDDPSRCIRHTTTDYRSYRSSLSGCRFGRSGSSGFVGGFCLLRWSSLGLAPRVRSCRDRCRDRYTCRPKRSGFGFRGRSRLNHAGMTFLKLLRFSDGLCLSFFCPRRRRCRTKFLLCRFLKILALTSWSCRS